MVWHGACMTLGMAFGMGTCSTGTLYSTSNVMQHWSSCIALGMSCSIGQVVWPWVHCVAYGMSLETRHTCYIPCVTRQDLSFHILRGIFEGLQCGFPLPEVQQVDGNV